MKLRLYLHYIFKDLLHDRGRSLLTIISLAAVIISTLAAMALSEAFVNFGESSSGGQRNLLVLSEYALDPKQSRIDHATLEAMANIVRSNFGQESLVAAFPALYRTVDINGKTLQVLCIPLERMLAAYGLVLQAGSWPQEPNQVVATPQAVKLNDWQVGEVISLRGRAVVVAGIVQDKAAQTSSLWMSYESGKVLFSAGGEFQIGVLQIAPGLDMEMVQSSLEADPRFIKGYAVLQSQQLYGRYGALLKDMNKLSTLLAALSLIMITFGTYNACSLTLLERKVEVGILQAVGFSAGGLGGFLLVRTLLLVAAGFVIAWGAALWIVQLSNQDPFLTHGKAVILQLDGGTIGISLLLALVSACLGVGLSLWAQNKRSPAANLRR